MRLALFYLLIFFSQSFWGAWFAPLPAPDLFLLAVLTLLWRVSPWQLVLIGYGIGLLQDALSGGNFGLHALGLAGGAMGALLVRSQITQKSFLERSMAVLLGVAGKWLTVIPLLVWQSGNWTPLRGVLDVFPAEGLFTIFFALLLLPWGEALMERDRVLRKELL